MATYNILIMGASYGSLLASKLLFGGHSVHLVCLPAEADLINAEGFRVRLPVKGRKDPVVLDSRKLPGKVTAGPAAGVNPPTTISSGLRCRSRNTARPACANCSTRWQVARALHVDHEHAAAALPEAHPGPRLRCAQARLHRPDACGTASIPSDHAEQPRPAGDPPAGREGQRAAWSRCRPTSRWRASTTTSTPPSCASWRRTIEARASTPATARSSCRSSSRCTTRSSCRSPSGRCCSPATTAASPRTACDRAGGGAHRPRDLALGLQLRRSTCASSSAPSRTISCRSRNTPPPRSLVRPASAARALNNGVPNIERADKLVQLIAKQKGLSHPVIDAPVALVDSGAPRQVLCVGITQHSDSFNSESGDSPNNAAIAARNLLLTFPVILLGFRDCRGRDCGGKHSRDPVR